MVLWNGQRLVERKLKIQCVSTVFHICKGIANMYVDFLSHIQIIGLKVASGCTAAQPSGAELPTGSGAAESDRKQIVGSRFKRGERRWPRAGASALLAVKLSFKNNRWTDFLDRRACRPQPSGQES